MKPNKEQIKKMMNLYSAERGKSEYELFLDIWDYVEGELNKIYPLPTEAGFNSIHTQYLCRSCNSWSFIKKWVLEAPQGITTLTCPECGAVHSEMIKGDDQ